MNQKRLIALLLCGFTLLFAGNNYQKIKSYQTGPGAHYNYYEEQSVPWCIHVLKIDLDNPYTSLESAKAGDRIEGREGVSSMTSRKEAPGHRIVGAVNGDFYNTSNGTPINNQIVNGEFVRGFTAGRSVFAYSDLGKSTVFIPQFSGTILSVNDTTGEPVSYSLNSVNMTRYADQIVLYNSFMGSNTGANEWGYECLMNPITDWTVNDTVFAVVEKRESYEGNMEIPEGKFVLSGHGRGTSFLQDYCMTGDTLKIVQKMNSNLKRITQLIGGGPRLLENGSSVVSEHASEGVSSSFCTARHPRTASGFNADSTVAYFIVVDGRQEHSAGMSLYELADFMKHIGVSHATNLDGGGSSTFVIRNDVMNSPSDNWERWVANSMMCVSSAPDSDFAIVQIERDSVALYKKSSVDLPMSGWDIYYNPREISNWDDVNISYSQELGSFSEGVFTASDHDADGNFIADYQGRRDTLKIHIIRIDSLRIYPDLTVTDTVRSIPFHIEGCEDGAAKKELDPAIFDMTLLDPSLGTIDENAVFTPLQTGESELVVSYGDEKDTCRIRVESGSEEVSFREMESLNDWSLEGENLTDATTIQLVDRDAGTGSKAFKIDYTTEGSGEIHLLDNQPSAFYGIPSEILIDIKSDGLRHKLYVECEDATGESYKYKYPGYLDYTGYQTVVIPTETPIPTDNKEYYPMTLKYLNFDLKTGDQSGTLFVDRIRLVYPGWTSIEKMKSDMLPKQFVLEQNYPNPFNPETDISYSISERTKVSLDIFDINGRYVETLYYGVQSPGTYTITFNADHLSAGIYCYRLITENRIKTKKMLLLK